MVHTYIEESSVHCDGLKGEELESSITIMADSGAFSGPRDAAVMEAILKEMGVEDYEPNVINQMLEFSYSECCIVCEDACRWSLVGMPGYVTNVLEDARVYSEHAQKKELDISDIKLAVQAKMDHSFTTPPPRDVCMYIQLLHSTGVCKVFAPTKATCPTFPHSNQLRNFMNVSLLLVQKPCKTQILVYGTLQNKNISGKWNLRSKIAQGKQINVEAVHPLPLKENLSHIFMLSVSSWLK